MKYSAAWILKPFKPLYTLDRWLEYGKPSQDPEGIRAKFLFEWRNPFKCEKCGARFRSKQKFKEHKIEFHSY